MEFTKKESYALQIGIYIKSGQLADGCSLAESMLKKFPKAPLSHFMAAKCYFFARRYGNAKLEALRAHNLSTSKNDLLLSAFLAASAMFFLEEYQKAYDLLLPYKKENSYQVKKLLLMLSMVLRKGSEAARFYTDLHSLNSGATEAFILGLAKQRARR